MFDPIRGGFPDYTHMAVGYCSSDAWMGQTSTTDFAMVGGTKVGSKTGTYWHGFYITQTILKYFLQLGMGTSGMPEELFVSGCSAGSIAATAMADSWTQRLYDLAIEMKIASFKVPYVWSLLDGAPIVSPPESMPGHDTIFQYAMKLVKQLYGPDKGTSPSAFINQACTARVANAGECVWTTTVLPFIKSRNLVLVMLWDNFVTGDQFYFFTPGNYKQYDFGLKLVAMTRVVMAKVTPSQNFFASGCGDHCISDNPYFWRLVAPTSGSTMTAKDMTIATRDGHTGKVITDMCNDYNCGCLGQSSALTKLADASLANMMFAKMTGMQGAFSSTMSLAVAADQTYNLGQYLMSP